MGKNKRPTPIKEEKKEPMKEIGLEIKEVTVTEAEGIVDGVTMNLNIRKEPKVEPNNQIGIVGKGTKLIIMAPEKDHVSEDGIHWFKVKFGNPPTVGYAMKKYIRML